MPSGDSAIWLKPWVRFWWLASGPRIAPSSSIGSAAAWPLALAGLVEETFRQAREAYGGEAWSSQVVKLLEDELGVDLRAPGFPAQLGACDLRSGANLQ